MYGYIWHILGEASQSHTAQTNPALRQSKGMAHPLSRIVTNESLEQLAVRLYNCELNDLPKLSTIKLMSSWYKEICHWR